MAFAISKKRLGTTGEPSTVSTTSCGPSSLLPIGQLCCKEQLPQPWAPFHARVFSGSRLAASLFPNFNLLAVREEFLERKRLRRVWLLDKQGNGGKRLVSTVWGELSLGPLPSPGACLPSSFGASISSLTKTSACFKTEIAMRFSSGRNVESCSEGHGSCWCQAAWPGMNSGCNKSPRCLLQQPQEVQIECFPRPARRRESDLPRGVLCWRHWEHPFLNTAIPLAFPRSFSDWHSWHFWQKRRSGSPCLQDSFVERYFTTWPSKPLFSEWFTEKIQQPLIYHLCPGQDLGRKKGVFKKWPKT